MDWKREGLPLINIILGGIGALILGFFPVIIFVVLLVVLPFIIFLIIIFSIAYLTPPTVGFFTLGDFIISYLESLYNVILITFLLAFSGATMMANSFLRMAGYTKRWLLVTTAISLSASAIVLFLYNPIINVVNGPHVGMDAWFFFALIGYLVFQSGFLLFYLLQRSFERENKTESKQVIDSDGKPVARTG